MTKYAWHGWVTRDTEPDPEIEFWGEEPTLNKLDVWNGSNWQGAVPADHAIALHFLPTACLPAPGKCHEVWVYRDGRIEWREVG